MASPGNSKPPSIGRLGSRSVSRTFSRHTSTTSRTRDEKKGWDRVKNSIKTGTLQFVGLKPTKDEERHWEAVQGRIFESRLKKGKSPVTSPQSAQPPLSIPRASLQPRRSVLKPQDAAAVRAITGTSIPPAETEPTPPPSATTRVRFVSDDGEAGEIEGARPSFKYSYSTPAMRPGVPYSKQPSVFSTAGKSTGRSQVYKTELKPDLWKVAIKGVYRQISQKKETRPPPRSFLIGEEDEYTEEVDYGEAVTSPALERATLTAIEEGVEDDDFFGLDRKPLEKKPLEPIEETDSAPPGAFPAVAYAYEPKPKPKPKPKPLAPAIAGKRRGRKVDLKLVKDLTLTGGYARGYGGLGFSTLLLQFKYNECLDQKVLDRDLLHKRPYFTYWLMVVHVLIMIITLAVYGFVPYGWDLRSETELVLQSNLAVTPTPRFVVPNVWGGPSQQSLVTLGAVFAPCMRRDRQLYNGINMDRNREADTSGCCIMRDQSGCFQTQESNNATLACLERFSDFESVNAEGRVVCGTSPGSCTNPSPMANQFIGEDFWEPNNTLTWPICLNSSINAESPEHLRCELTGRPCCFGIQAHCLITTAEHCEYLDGRFHPEAFLCSQVDCLNAICGLLEFRVPDEPDQVYRLWLALFLHAGIIHILLSLVFSFLVLRHVEKRLGWFRTAFVYILSGIGGNLVSAYFVPYNPGVGPASSILGIVAYMFVFLIFESRFLEKPWIEFLKLLGVTVGFFLIGLFPFIDNFAHIGGFVFGFLLSGIIVPYGNYKKVWDELDLDKGDKKFNAFYIIKLAMVIGGIPVVLLLFVLFFMLFYVVQDTWEGFSYLTCIPFTSTICTDMRTVVRDRDPSMPII